MLASSGRIDWGIKDRDGFNVLHLAVMKNDLMYGIYFLKIFIQWVLTFFSGLRAIHYVLKYMDQDLGLELIQETQSTVLHHACSQQNFEVNIMQRNHLLNMVM